MGVRERCLALLAIALLALPGAGAAQQQPAENQPPEATVERLHGALLEAWRSGAGFDGRREQLAPVIRETLDIDLMARFVLGATWKSIEPEQRESFVDLFGRLTVSTYADRFGDYSGEQFETLDTRDLPGGRKVVRTQLVKSDGERISLDYLLHRPDDRWLIANILAKGVSDLAVKRSEYRSVVDSRGFDALRDELEQKIREMAASNEAADG